MAWQALRFTRRLSPRNERPCQLVTRDYEHGEIFESGWPCTEFRSRKTAKAKVGDRIGVDYGHILRPPK